MVRLQAVAPLDGQFGVWPLRQLPQGVAFDLFGSNAQAESSLTSSFYAVLDATQIFGLKDIMTSAGLVARCLYTGASAREFADVAPYLVELPLKHQFTRRIFTKPDSPGGLWKANLGIFLQSEASFESLWKHLRRFTRVRSQDAHFSFFRFWDPRVLGDYLQSVELTNDPILSIFFAQDKSVSIVTASEYETLRFELSGSNVSCRSTGPIAVDVEKLARQAAVRMIEAYAKLRHIPIDRVAVSRSSYDFRKFSETDLKILTLLHGHFRITSRYNPDHFPELTGPHDTYSKQILDQTKAARLARLEFFVTQGVSLGV